MVIQAGKMYRSSDIAFDTSNDTVYVVEQFNHRVSKWNYTAGSFDFTLDAGQVTSIDFSGGAGTGYSVLDPVNISAPTLDIANPVTASAQVASVGGMGEITGITVTQKGNGYDPNNLPAVDAPTSGTSAVLVAVVSTPWGNNGDGTTGTGGPIGDGGPTDGNFYRPTGIAFDGTRLIVTDTFHNRIRTINPNTGAFLGSVGQGGSGVADFYHPAGIATDGTTLVIADELNHRAVKYDVGVTPSNPAELPAPTPLAFNRPHGVIFEDTNNFFMVTDSFHGVISRYNTVATSFEAQFGTAGTTGTKLFFPSSGHGILTGDSTTAFADTRNNILKTVAIGAIANTSGTNAGTGTGQLYYPESVASFSDTNDYVLAANTLNNRVEVFTNSASFLSFNINFGNPLLFITLTTSLSVGTIPRSIAVNETTNRIYMDVNTDIAVIDGATNTVIDAINVGFSSRGIAVNEKTNKIYVVRSFPGSVTVIDGETNTVIPPTISVGDIPNGIDVNESTNTIYVANSDDDTVSIINGFNNMVISIDVGNSPLGVAVNDTTNTIYVTNRIDNTVSVIDGATNTVTTTISVGDRPRGVAVNESTNKIYVANNNDATVAVIDGATNTVIDAINVREDPDNIAVNEITNTIYVTNQNDGTISVISGNGNTEIAVASVPGTGSIRAIAVNSTTNNIYVTKGSGIGTLAIYSGN